MTLDPITILAEENARLIQERDRSYPGLLRRERNMARAERDEATAKIARLLDIVEALDYCLTDVTIIGCASPGLFEQSMIDLHGLVGLPPGDPPDERK